VAEFVKVAALSEVPPGTLLAVEVGGQRVCLANVDGELYAVRDNCSHRDFPLSSGELDDGEVTCSWHGARFDVRSGRALALPAIRPVATFEVRLEGDEIHVAV
jgi:3-phenylpropionate/trans-cinnamate dioxygenase ferredoxin component